VTERPADIGDHSRSHCKEWGPGGGGYHGNDHIARAHLPKILRAAQDTGPGGDCTRARAEAIQEIGLGGFLGAIILARNVFSGITVGGTAIRTRFQYALRVSTLAAWLLGGSFFSRAVASASAS